MARLEIRKKLTPTSCTMLILLGFAGLFQVFAFADDLLTTSLPLNEHINHSNHELNELRTRIETHRQQLSELSGQESDANLTLEGLVKEVALVKTLLTSLDNRERILAAQRDTLQVRLEIHHQTYAARQQNLSRRMVDIYRHGNQRPLELIMTSESFTSLLTRLRFSAMMARVDGSLVSQTRQQALQIELEQRQLQAALAGIWEAREEGTQERARLELLEAERRTTLREIQDQREFAKSNLNGLRNSEQQLVNLIESLELQRQAELNPTEPQSTSLADNAGHLRWPAAGRVVRQFGRSVHPQFKTVTINNGINIATTVGAPVYAVAPGKVEFADHLPGFGVCVILDHGAGFYTLYANLDRVFVIRGDDISQNEILAEVGESDDEAGPQLYFEIRQGKTPMNPLDWLQPRG